MDLAEYQHWWQDEGIAALGMYLSPGISITQVLSALRSATEGRQALFIRSNADIRALSMRIFERTFVITRVLYWLGAGGGAGGRGGARARPGRAQTAFMEIAALLAAIPAGLLTAVVLTDVINRRAFGWQIDLHLSRAQSLDALWLALGAALAAGAYPAWRSARAPLAPGMREE